MIEIGAIEFMGEASEGAVEAPSDYDGGQSPPPSLIRKREQVRVDEIVTGGLGTYPPVEDVATGADDPDPVALGRGGVSPSGHFSAGAVSFDELLDVVKDSHDGPPAHGSRARAVPPSSGSKAPMSLIGHAGQGDH